METLAHTFLEYIIETTGQSVAWGTRVSADLPQYINQRYSLFEIAINRKWFLGIIVEDNTDFRPATFEKHLRKIIPRVGHFEGYCLIANYLPAYVRKRLIEREIPFVIPKQQIFWPALGVVIQARKATKGLVPVESVSPATQAVLVFALTGGITKPVNSKFLATKLEYTTMTMSRALNEIMANKIARVERKGRERLLYPESTRLLWDRALSFMCNPVRDIVRIKENRLPQNLRVVSGETALSDMSMILPPREAVYALGRKAWKKLAGNVETIPIEDKGTCQIQLWKYDPALFIDGGMVDPFSLYLAMKDDMDDRIQTALEQIMERI